jgi:chromosomal replication initiator protein
MGRAGESLMLETAVAKVPEMREGDCTINEVLDAVAWHCGVTVDEVLSGRPPRPRLLAKYLACRVTRHSLRQIGARFGGVGSTNVMHAVRVIERYMASDAEFAIAVEDIKASLIAAAARANNE